MGGSRSPSLLILRGLAGLPSTLAAHRGCFNVPRWWGGTHSQLAALASAVICGGVMRLMSLSGAGMRLISTAPLGNVLPSAGASAWGCAGARPGSKGARRSLSLCPSAADGCCGVAAAAGDCTRLGQTLCARVCCVPRLDTAALAVAEGSSRVHVAPWHCQLESGQEEEQRVQDPWKHEGRQQPCRERSLTLKEQHRPQASREEGSE